MTTATLPARPAEAAEPARTPRTTAGEPAPGQRRQGGGRSARKGPLARVIDTLSSVKFAVGVVVVIAVACVAGTLIPQGNEAARYVQVHPEATGRMELAARLGLTNLYSAAWFIGLLGLLSATVAVCSSRRFSTVLRSKGFARSRALGSMFTHISILLILGGGIIRGVWGDRGFLEFHEGQTAASFRSERRGVVSLPFALRLADFTVETYADPAAPVASPAAGQTPSLQVHWPERNVMAELPVRLNEEQIVGPTGAAPAESFRITVIQYEPDFVIGEGGTVTSRSAEPRNPAVQLDVNGPGYSNKIWLFARYPGMTMKLKNGTPGEPPVHMSLVSGGPAAAPAAAQGAPVKAFRSTVDVVDNGRASFRTTTEVNHPFSYKGWSFYQSGYNPDDPGWTSLEVVKDPGVPVVYAGFLFMIAGLFIVFYLSPWLRAREKTR